MIAWVVLKGKDAREFKRLFSSEEAAEDYITSGKKAKIQGAEEEFVEGNTVRDS